MALLIPKLRSHYAEFLNHSCLDRLGILYLPTCVGLGYGHQQHSLEVFLESMGLPTSSLSTRHQSSGICATDLPIARPTTLNRDNQRPDQLPFSVTPSVLTRCQWYRNVYLLCIDYALRPRLSSRLTLGGLALPRNP